MPSSRSPVPLVRSSVSRLFADEAEAWAKYEEMIRVEWDNLMDADDGPYPGDPDEAQDRIRQAHGAEWSRWELTCHEIEIPAVR
jgi:hypothetical protein